MSLGNPLDAGDHARARWRSARFADLVREQIAEAVRKGAKAHDRPEAFADDSAGSPYLAPQVLTDVDHR